MQVGPLSMLGAVLPELWLQCTLWVVGEWTRPRGGGSVWFWRGCVASVANIRKFYSAAMISGHKKKVGPQPKLFLWLQLHARMPPRILNGNGNAVPTRRISWTLLVFTKFCCESLWTRLTDNVAILFWQHAVRRASICPPSIGMFCSGRSLLATGVKSKHKSYG